jgi:hypothetical protein
MSREKPNGRSLDWIARAVAAAVAIACAGGSSGAATQPSNRMATLIETLRPVLPFPAADVNGDVPVRGGESAKWFVVWPEPGDQTVVVRANPLHRDTQTSGAEAMARIQEAVVAAERKAQAAYDRALKELQQTGKGSSLDGVTLEDEGVAGERIDAELELVITLESPSSFEIGSSRAPLVAASANGATWTITTTANTYKEGSAATARDRFRPAEARLVFGNSPKPTVDRRGDQDRYTVTVANAPNTFVVVLRGNEALLAEVLAKTEWSKLR